MNLYSELRCLKKIYMILSELENLLLIMYCI